MKDFCGFSVNPQHAKRGIMSFLFNVPPSNNPCFLFYLYQVLAASPSLLDASPAMKNRHLTARNDLLSKYKPLPEKCDMQFRNKSIKHAYLIVINSNMELYSMQKHYYSKSSLNRLQNATNESIRSARRLTKQDLIEQISENTIHQIVIVYYKS